MKCFKRLKPCKESPNEVLVKQEMNTEEEEAEGEEEEEEEEEDVKPSLPQIESIFSITAEEEEEKSKFLTGEIDNMITEIETMM